MGCGGSKETENVSANVPMVRDPQAGAATRVGTRAGTHGGTHGGTRSGTRPATARGRRTAGGSAAHTRAQPSRQGGSRSGSRQASAGPSSSHGRHRHERHHHPPLSALKEQAPEDSIIRHEISTLNTYIDQHTENHYRSSNDSKGIPIRRRIGETIINNVIKGNMSGTVPVHSFQLFLCLDSSASNREVSCGRSIQGP
jgi:hypothetical protein